MAETSTNKFSAGERGLRYIYQARLALLHLLPEETVAFRKKGPGLDFVDGVAGKSRACLKHKVVGDKLSDLCTYAWKSVNA